MPVDVGCWPKADMAERDFNARFREESRHRADARQCLLMTRSGRSVGMPLTCFLRRQWARADKIPVLRLLLSRLDPS
jgi:hypothetical protein